MFSIREDGIHAIFNFYILGLFGVSYGKVRISTKTYSNIYKNIYVKIYGYQVFLHI